MKQLLFIFALLTCFSLSAIENENPKREFRGAWLHVIGQSQWQNKSTAKAQEYIREQFRKLRDAGCNAVIFQVRPTADAVYKSELEPWSFWLTGRRGREPQPMWDPMEYAIEEAHRLGMEFHAWLNPYRVTSTAKEVLPADHASNVEPHRFFRYNGQILFDPAWQENRDFICRVVDDIVSRYDVDAIHIDDYFYPYPQKGVDIPDTASYAKFGNGMKRADWRRQNVDLLIEQLHKTIKDRKSWVRFGVSPFGIWRNKASDPRGSESNGLQNYDDLYADVISWSEKGWVDYLVPQLYWNLDTKAAPSRKLVKWWNDNVKGSDLYIGQDVQRTMSCADPGNNDRNELDTKVKLTRQLPNVKGNVWWHGYWVTDNLKGVADSLALKYQSTIALPPVYGNPALRPAPVTALRLTRNADGSQLEWKTEGATNSKQNNTDTPAKETDAVRFVIYEFHEGEAQDINDAAAIIAVTAEPRFQLTPTPGAIYVVTALDRNNRESAPVTLKI